MLKTRHAGKELFVFLSGEIDHCTAGPLRAQIEAQIEEFSPTRLHLDFADVSFMDSSGVGMVIGRYKTMMERGGSVTAGGFKPHVEKLFRLAGLHRIIQIAQMQEDA